MHPLARQRAVVNQHPQQLAEEQRIALGGLEDSLQQGRRQVDPAKYPLDELTALARVQRIELDHLARTASGRGQRLAHLPQLGPRERHQQQRRVAHPLDEVLDQVEEHRLAPMHVVEHHHQRPPVGHRFE